MKGEKRTKNRGGWLAYAGMGMQFLAAILAAVLAGRWLDKQVGWQTPWLSMLLPVLTVVGTIYQIYKQTQQ